MESNTNTIKPKRRKRINWWPIIGLAFFCYMLIQVYIMYSGRVDTVKAVTGYINDSIISQGIVCRKEMVLAGRGGGAVDYIARDGERVSVGSVIANVYPAYSDVENVNFLKNREKIYNDLLSASSYFTGAMFDMPNTKKQLSDQLCSLAQSRSVGGYDLVQDILADATLGLNKIQVATGKTKDFSSAKAVLEGEINSAKSLISRPLQNLTSPHTGYFIRYSDGYENTANADNFISMSYEEGMNIISGAPDKSGLADTYGKIITDYKWSVCTYLDKEQAKNLYEGMRVNVSLTATSNKFTAAVIEALEDKGDKVLVVLECTIMDHEAATARIVDCEILFKQYEGIKIPKSAIHFEDGNMGVYVKFANVVNFKKISPIYEDDNYIIVPRSQSRDNQVKLHDFIIVKGKNLYDGKYL